MEQTRDNHGRFVKGNGGGPGRPKRVREERYYEITTNTCTFKDWEDIVKKAVSQAKRGDAVARKWLSDFLVGVPEQPISGALRIIVDWEEANSDNSQG